MQVRYLSCRDVSKMTNKSIRTVWGWCNSGKLKASRPGGRDYLIKEADLAEFLESDSRRTEKKEA